jgi:hypothetical protein
VIWDWIVKISPTQVIDGYTSAVVRVFILAVRCTLLFSSNAAFGLKSTILLLQCKNNIELHSLLTLPFLLAATSWRYLFNNHDRHQKFKFDGLFEHLIFLLRVPIVGIFVDDTIHRGLAFGWYQCR